MQFRTPLDEIFHGRAATRVLRVLALFPAKEFTGRELAQEAAVSPSNAIVELNRFLEQGLVRRRIAGRSQLWRLDTTHVIGENVRDIFEFEYALDKDLRQRIAQGVRRIPGLERAVLFGSVARKEERPSSDVDLLLLVRRAADKKGARQAVSALRQEIGTRFRNRLQPIIYSMAEWHRGEGASLIRSIEQEGQLVWERSS